MSTGLTTFVNGTGAAGVVAKLNALQAQMVQTYYSRTHRDENVTAPYVGQLVYVGDGEGFTRYDGTRWRPLKPHRTFVRAMSGGTAPSGTGLLSIGLGLWASRTYRVWGWAVDGHSASTARIGCDGADFAGLVSVESNTGLQQVQATTPTFTPNAETITLQGLVTVGPTGGDVAWITDNVNSRTLQGVLIAEEIA